MFDQRKRIFAVNRWLLDLFLTTTSFLLAYYIRNRMVLEGHTVMELGVYLWILAIILPTWAVLLPAFRVYSEPSGPTINHILRLSKAIAFAGLVMAAILAFVKQDAATNRVMVLLTVVIDYIFLVSYRLALLRLSKYAALDIRHVA